MATFKDGINGPFKGKVGSVIGYQWRGIWVMRGLPRFKNKKRSPKQLANQAKMRLMQRFLQGVKGFIDKGFYALAEERRMSAFNAAMSYNKKHAIKGEYPDFEIDYSQFMFAQGELDIPVNVQVHIVDSSMEFTWDAETSGSWNDDQVMLLIVDPVLPLFDGITSGAKRSEGKEIIKLHDSQKGMIFETYIAFVSDDRKRTSNSIYCGRIEFK